MSSTITDFTYQKRDRNRVNVFLDGEYAFSVSIMAAGKLRTGQHLDNNEIKRLKKDYDQHVGYNKAVGYLARSPRSIMEISRYLQNKGYTKDTVSTIVDLLKDKKYLNDEEFARLFVENRERFSPRSAFALRVELRQKGVDHEVIDHTLLNIDEKASAWSAIETKIHRWKVLPETKFKHKVMGLLSRRGFNYDISLITYEKALNIAISEE